MAAANQDRTSIFCMEHMKLKKRPYPLKKKQLFDVEEYSKELNSILTNQLFGLCDLQWLMRLFDLLSKHKKSQAIAWLISLKEQIFILSQIV